MRNNFNEKLNTLREEVLRLGALVEEALLKGTGALKTKNLELAETVIQGDAAINSLQLRLEDEIVTIIATDQPVARDLRLLVSMLKIVSNLERMGDHAVHLAKAAVRFRNEPYVIPIDFLEKMATLGVAMVHDVISAFMDGDEAWAREIAQHDAAIDDLHKQVVDRILKVMREDGNSVEQAARLLLIARFLERLGDHVTNICEWVVFTETGNHVELN